MNIITLHAADFAGNVTTTNFSFTVDYSSKTNPPVVQLTWPLDGMQIVGDTFTIRGQVDDPTVTVSATVTDTNGDVNMVNGLVERDGRFWLENLPLNTGTNSLSITVSNVVGNATVTNISLVPSALTLTMTPVSDPSQLWQPTVSVGGTISDASYAVWADGVKGTNNGDGTWSATVPTTPGGVAIFDVTAYPPAEAPSGTSTGTGLNPQTPNAANNTTNEVDKPSRLYMESYTEFNGGSAVNTGPDGYQFTFDRSSRYDWADGVGGGGGAWNDWQASDDDGWWLEQQSIALNNPPSAWSTVAQGTNTMFEHAAQNMFGVADDVTNNSVAAWTPLLVNEHCNVQVELSDAIGRQPLPWAGSWYDNHSSGQYNRTADSKWKFQTGGKTSSQLKKLYQLSATATELLGPLAYPELGEGQTVWIGLKSTLPIPATEITLGEKPLGSDGKQWQVYADNAIEDVTPIVKNKDYYTFNVDPPMKIDLLDLSPSEGTLRLFASPPTYIVCQCGGDVIVTAGTSPALTEEQLPPEWSFIGGTAIGSGKLQRKVAKTSLTNAITFTVTDGAETKALILKGDTVVNQLWRQINTTAGSCPCVTGTGTKASMSDRCGNLLVINCESPGVLTCNHWVFRYNGAAVGTCLYEPAVNYFYYRTTQYGCKIAATWHLTRSDSGSPYKWTITQTDLITGTSSVQAFTNAVWSESIGDPNNR